MIKFISKACKLKFVALVLIVLMQFVFILPPQKAYAFSNPATVPLLTVSNFAALAATAVSSPLLGTVLNNGDLGINAGCTDFPSPCTTPGTKGTVTGGAIHNEDGVATQGQSDATAAVSNIGGRSSDATLSTQLGGQTLTQGVYTVAHDSTSNLTGDLTLNGDANSVFIFHLTSDLVTSTGSRVVLGTGVQACNVFWKVDSSATFNGTTQMVGTVLAQASVTFPGGGATLNGRAIAQTAAITFNNTTVNNSACATNPTPTPTLTPTPTPTPGNDFSFPSCPSVLPKTGDIAHYINGNHQIVGGSVLSGSDDVYSLEQNNYLQCFCPAVGNQGIQTNWLRTDTPIDGWFFLNGTQWNLGNFNYAVQNVNFTCQSTLHSLTQNTIPTPTPTKKPTPTPTKKPTPIHAQKLTPIHAQKLTASHTQKPTPTPKFVSTQRFIEKHKDKKVEIKKELEKIWQNLFKRR